MTQVLMAAVLLALAAAGWLAARVALRRARTESDRRAAGMLEEAEQRAQARLQEARLEAEERRSAATTHVEDETRAKREEIQRLDERLKEQERNIARKLQLLGQKQQEQDERESRLRDREERLAALDKESQALVAERRARLERIAGITARDARRELLREIESETRQEAANVVRRVEEETQVEASGRARRIVAEAIQRLPTADLVDGVVTVVKLPSDDMKGRIIGREGRNIRSLEMATGVDVIVDETPQSIVLSSFDPLRRAVARLAIERLIEDGRIHPARIEEMVTRARAEVEEGLDAVGEAAAFELGITGLPARLLRLLGKLRYRVVLGFNLLDHSLDVARLGC